MRTCATVSTLQYGLRNYNVDQLKQKCLEHIEAISNWENIIGDSETLSWKLLRAICRFQEADLIAKQACIYFLGDFQQEAYCVTEQPPAQSHYGQPHTLRQKSTYHFQR